MNMSLLSDFVNYEIEQIKAICSKKTNSTLIVFAGFPEVLLMDLQTERLFSLTSNLMDYYNDKLQGLRSTRLDSIQESNQQKPHPY